MHSPRGQAGGSYQKIDWQNSALILENQSVKTQLERFVLSYLPCEVATRVEIRKLSQRMY